jgi:general stress protein YciG
LYIGVVGAFKVSADQPPMAEKGGSDEAEKKQEDKQAALQLGRHGGRSKLGQKCKQI